MAKKRVEKTIKKLEQLSEDLDVAKAASAETLKVVKRAKETTEQAKRDLQVHQNPDYGTKRKTAK